MRRVLLVFEPPDGGVAEQVLQLARLLPQQGWATAVAGPADAAIYPALTQEGIATTRLDIDRGIDPRRYLRSGRQLTTLLHDGGFDIVHAHSSKAGGLARLAAKVAGVPAVYTPHCYAFVGPQGAARRVAVRAVERGLAPLTAATICVASDERRVALAAQIGKPEHLHVVHNAASACAEEAEPDPELAAFAAQGPLAGVVTALRPQKAVEVFLEAAPTILASVPEARLAVVGNGPEQSALELHARQLGLDERVRFFDFHRPASRQLRSLDVFVLPSLWEAFPISVLEALACGVPQVATAVGGTGEAVADGETGLLCPPGDPEALAVPVVSLLRDADKRRRMAEASRARHAALFTLDRMAAETATVYGSVLP